MKHINFSKKAAALGAALLMAATLPLCALAETSQFAGGGGMAMGGGIFIDESQLSQDQQAAYQAALADYQAIEDQQLTNLVNAGTITQQEMDEYTNRRSEPRQTPTGERSETGRMDAFAQLTDEQLQAAMAAMQSVNRDQAVADLVAQGILTQEQADAMAQMPQGDPNGQTTRQMSLWGKVRQASETDTAAQIALNNMQVATEMMQQALTSAGIQIPQAGQPGGTN